MKRPPGLWVLLSAGVLWLSLQDVYGIRATALIFGKSSTTTTTEASNAADGGEEGVTEASTEVANVTAKSNLTGIPQVDYVLDPNLPKELNGYNLSDYPFYERVPEEDIDFKCDGLHDGFYASVPHKCQVYHHCLFGTRYDFLCANFTAFDQKTFICHFVSEVDCVNSKKYWHRNDALYQAASTTTTPKPLPIYTPPPSTAAPPPAPRRPPGGRRRPFRRRPSDIEYYDYDDYEYEERPVAEARRRRPRPRPRPIYDDEYEEYDDYRYERRGTGRRDEERNRKPHDRRDDRRPGGRRRNNKDRRKYEDEEAVDEDVKVEDERKVSDKRPAGDRRYHKRRPADDYEEDDRRRSRPKGQPRRPVQDDDYEEDVAKSEPPPEPVVDRPLIKPTSGSIYDRPRYAPKIKPPVPKNEASKYAYKPISTSKTPIAADDEEYYDDEYEEEVPKSTRKPEPKERRPSTRRDEERDTRKQVPSASRMRPQATRDDLVEDEEEEAPRRPQRPKLNTHLKPRPQRPSSSKKPPVEEYYDDYEEEEVSKERLRTIPKVEKIKDKSTTTTTTQKPTTTTTTTTEPPLRDRPDSIVRIVKRPFLPSRGGNPFSARGLQPVGAKASDQKPETQEETKLESGTDSEVRPLFKPSPVIIKVPVRPKYQQTEAHVEEFKPVSNRPQTPIRQNLKANSKEYSGPRTTQKPKIAETDPLDIDDNEYDVTLNDALNPTLPNLPVRGFPTGFSSDYSYSPFQRPRYVAVDAAPAATRQRYEAVPYHGSPQDHFVNTNAEYKGQYSTISGQNYRPRIAQTFYSTY